MPSPNCWPEPDISIGSRCQSLDPLGISRYKCWSVREKSPAFLVWKQVSKTITALLDDQFEHLETRGAELMVEMFMVGKKPTSASPTIIFSCESKHSRQKAMEFVEKKSLLAKHPGVRMAHCSRLPRPLALGDDLKSISLPEGIYSYGPLGKIGLLSVLIVGKDYASPRKATIGGFFCINDEYYGLTTAHAFSTTSKTPVKDDVFDFAFYGESDLDESSEDDDDFEMTSKGSVSSLSSRSEGVSVDADDLRRIRQNSLASSPDSADTTQDKPTRELWHTLPSSNKLLLKIGTLHAISLPESSLDWALVKIDFNMLMYAALEFGNSTEKYLQLHRICDIVNNNISSRDIMGTTVEPTDSIAIIRTSSSDQLVTGTLSAATSWKRGPGNKKFQELWNVKLDSGYFVDGDCGSWAVNLASGRVYGHVVSGYPERGTAYLIPAVQVIKEIEEQLPGSHVTFPILRRPATQKSLFITEHPFVISTAKTWKASQKPEPPTDRGLFNYARAAKGAEQPTRESNIFSGVTARGAYVHPPSSGGVKPQPAFMYEVDEDGRSISGTKKSARIGEQPPSASQKTQSAKKRESKSNLGVTRKTPPGSKPRTPYVVDADEDGGPISVTRRSAKLETKKPVISNLSKPAAKPKSNLLDRASNGSDRSSAEKPNDKGEKDIKLERRRSSAIPSGKNEDVKPPLARENKKTSSTFNVRDRERPSHHGIPTYMATGPSSPTVGPSPQQAVPLRPQAIASQRYPHRPISFHAANSGYGPPLAASAYYQQHQLTPAPSYPPHQASSSTANYQPPSTPAPSYPPQSPSSPYTGYAFPPPNYITPSPFSVRPLSQRFVSADPIQRTSSAYGTRDLEPRQVRDGYDGEYLPPSDAPVVRRVPSIRAASERHRDSVQNGSESDVVRVMMPPPPLPEMLRRRRSATLLGEHPTELREQMHRGSDDYRQVPLGRPNSHRASTSYNVDRQDERVQIEVANNGKRRQSYYERPPSPEPLLMTGKYYDDMVEAAASYQKAVGGTITPLTAESLRRQQRQAISRSSSRSSLSRDESDYRKSNTTKTTRTTRSTVDSGNEDVTIKVVGNARVMVAGSQINCEEGGEIQIRRNNARNGSERSLSPERDPWAEKARLAAAYTEDIEGPSIPLTADALRRRRRRPEDGSEKSKDSGYGSMQGSVENRKTRSNRPSGQTKRRSDSRLSSHNPQYPTENYV